MNSLGFYSKRVRIDNGSLIGDFKTTNTPFKKYAKSMEKTKRIRRVARCPMYDIPALVRARIIALGSLSRPLGEARASQLACEMVASVVLEYKGSRSAELALQTFERRIRDEIAGQEMRPSASATCSTKGRPAPWNDLLADIPATA